MACFRPISTSSKSRFHVATSYEVVTKDSLPDWHLANGASARAFGARWLNELRTPILIVPSYVARIERNILINPRHAQAKAIRVGLETPSWWDDRLFES